MTTAVDRASRALRLLGPLVVGAGLAAFVEIARRMAPDRMTAAAVGVLVLQAYLISELCHGLGRALDRWSRWEPGSRTRLAVEIGLASTLSFACALALYIPIKRWLIAHGERDAIDATHVSLIAIAAIAVSLLLNLMRLVLELLTRWRQALATAAARERQVVQAQLDALRAQVNPHFLFNSLNTIYGIIAEDPARAQVLVVKLADVFRYALRHGHTHLVTLSDELQFAAAFSELLEVRHGAGLVIERRLRGGESELFVPPMTLQLLIENAVNHNRIDGEGALRIVIEHDCKRLRVHNTPRPRRRPSQGEGHGLKNIIERFELVGAPDIAIRDTPERFEVDVPLLRRP